jgi:hypothetical protein
MKKTILTSLALAGLATVASAQTFVNTDITANTTWSGTIILQQPIFVKNNATLTISAGTIVRGQPRTAAVAAGVIAGSPGALIVTQSGRIVANGTDTNPIIFTSAVTDNDNDGVADDADLNGFADAYDLGDVFLDDTPLTAPLAPLNTAGFANVALWGGVVILGEAPTNNADKIGIGYGKALVEGLTVPGFPAADATYGGVNPHDNSGSLRFVSIRHAGDEIGNGNELNGLTLGGVGDGTILENIEIYCNFDDGFEWFGGTVNGKNLAVFFAGDDAFDIDEGYTGTNQFCFAIVPFFRESDNTAYGSASGDKLGEFDGDNYRADAVTDNVNIRREINGATLDATPWPLSYSQTWNFTGIGTAPVAAPFFTPGGANPGGSNPGTKRGIQFRNGYAGYLFNSIIVNTGAETGFEIDGTANGAPSFNSTDNATNFNLIVAASTFNDGAALGANELVASNNGTTYRTRLGLGASSNNVVNSGTTGSLTQEDVSFNPTGDASGKLAASLRPSPINPRPAFATSGLLNGIPPQGLGLSNVLFRGAFDRTAPVLWTTGWTTLNKAGLLAN